MKWKDLVWPVIQGGSNMTRNDFFKTIIAKHLHFPYTCTPLRNQHIFSNVLEPSWCPFQKRLVVGGLFTHKSVPVIFEPPCIFNWNTWIIGCRQLVVWIPPVSPLVSSDLHSWVNNCNYKVLLPTDAQDNCFERSFKIHIKTAPTCFGVITIIRERTI
jgi:hypothetical protein